MRHTCQERQASVIVQSKSPLERLSDCRAVPYLRFFPRSQMRRSWVRIPSRPPKFQRDDPERSKEIDILAGTNIGLLSRRAEPHSACNLGIAPGLWTTTPYLVEIMGAQTFGEGQLFDYLQNPCMFIDLSRMRNLIWRHSGGHRLPHRTNDFALPHPRKTRWRRHGYSLQSRRHPPAPQRRPQIPPR